MLPIKKIYIHTLQKTADSASHSDFSVDLPTTYLMPDDTGFYVEDVCLPIAWWTVEEGVNDTLLWGQQLLGFDGTLPRMDRISAGIYTSEELGAAIVKVMNATFGVGATAVNDGVRWKKTNSTNALLIDTFATSTASNGFTYITSSPVECKWRNDP